MEKEFTQIEQEILNAFFEAGYKYIVRNENGDLVLFSVKPDKGFRYWLVYNSVTKKILICTLPMSQIFFKNVTWEDEEPTKIKYVELHEKQHENSIKETDAHDVVDSPKHYKGKLGLEAIDVLRNFLTEEEFRGFVKGNVIKYVLRESHKNGDEDLKKAKKNLEFLGL